MKTTAIKIEGKSYNVKFGYAFLRYFGEHFSLKSYQETINFIEDKLGDLIDITFEQEDILKAFFKYAVITANPSNPEHRQVVDIETVDVLSFVTQDVDVLVKMFEAFRSSFPQLEGKPQPRTRARKKK